MLHGALSMYHLSYNCNLAMLLPNLPCSYVINLILSGEEIEKVIEKIQAHLSQLALEVNSGKTPLQEFAITKVTLCDHVKYH